MQKTETMNLQVHLRGMRNSGGLDALIEESLTVLHRLIPVSIARVVLERQRQSKPTYCVFAHLAVPGPDIHAEARDYTLAAAWRKLVANLEQQFQRRAVRQQLRLKGREQCRPVTSQRSRGA